jgi:hypothetical protein
MAMHGRGIWACATLPTSVDILLHTYIRIRTLDNVLYDVNNKHKTYKKMIIYVCPVITGKRSLTSWHNIHYHCPCILAAKACKKAIGQCADVHQLSTYLIS